MATQGFHRVSAEVVPRAGQARRAAGALRDLGFRIRHVGATISVDAPAPVWVRVFGVSFEPGSEISSIPPALRDLVTGVYFVPPPDLHE